MSEMPAPPEIVLVCPYVANIVTEWPVRVQRKMRSTMPINKPKSSPEPIAQARPSARDRHRREEGRDRPDGGGVWKDVSVTPATKHDGEIRHSS